MKLRAAAAMTVSLLLHAVLFAIGSGSAADNDEQLPPGSGEGIESSPGEEAAAAAPESLPSIVLSFAPPAAAAESVAPAPAPANPGGGESYLGKVRMLLDRRAQQLAGRLQQHGACEVRFEVRADGSIGTLALATSSGSERLDAEALALVRDSSPLPAPPQAIRLRVPIEFR